MKATKLLALLPLLFLTSCATMVNGNNQRVCISSSPAGANVWVDGDYTGTTPLETCLSRSEEHRVCYKLDGYEPYEVKITQGISTVFFGNILVGGPFGMVVDMYTGAMYRLSPSDVHASLQSNTAPTIGALEQNDFVLAGTR